MLKTSLCHLQRRCTVSTVSHEQSVTSIFALQHPLRRVTVCSDAMRQLTWRGCASLDQVLLACAYLQEAEFLGCAALSDEVLLTLGDLGKSPLVTSRGIQGGCPRLR